MLLRIGLVFGIVLSLLSGQDHVLSDDTNTSASLPLTSPVNIEKMDTIIVKGALLQGQVVGLDSEYLYFKLIYAQGRNRIEYKDIEQLSTEHEYRIFYKGDETEGKIVSIKDHTWLVVKHDGIGDCQ